MFLNHLNKIFPLAFLTLLLLFLVHKLCQGFEFFCHSSRKSFPQDGKNSNSSSSSVHYIIDIWNQNSAEENEGEPHKCPQKKTNEVLLFYFAFASAPYHLIIH